MDYIIKKWKGSTQTFSFNGFYVQFSTRLEEYGIVLMRVALAIVFVWFGALKLAGMSPAQELVERTIYWIPAKIFMPFLGCWEVAIGLGLLIKRFIPYTIVLLLLHMVGTFLPMFILPDVCFDAFPFCPSLEGQYILKNLVLVAGALSVAGRYRTES